MSPISSNASAVWRLAAPFMVVAVLAIVGGGLISAALAHAPTQRGMWLVAYLVLVVGVAQWLIGVGQSRLARLSPSVGLVATECTLFNTGNGLVVAGTLVGHIAWVGAGALLLIAALMLFLHGVRHTPGSAMLYAYRALLLLVGASAIVGLVLATVRARA